MDRDDVKHQECQPRFSSPSGSQPPDELESLRAAIHAANELLHTLTNPPEHELFSEQLRMNLRHLRGQLVRLSVECGEEKSELIGSLQDAGHDYLILHQVGRKQLVPYTRICNIHRDDGPAGGGMHMSLTDIDPWLRREIALRFGEVVSRSPDLINIFFGLSLHLQLAAVTGCHVRVKLEGERREVAGILCDVDEESILLKLQEDEQQPDKAEDAMVTGIDTICWVILH